jgi:hypothetical protein
MRRALLCCLLSACAAPGGRAPEVADTHRLDDDGEGRPPVTELDVRIVRRTRELLASPATWNRVDNRSCPADAVTFSLYCALATATTEVYGRFEHRGVVMQEARLVIEEIAPGREYEHRLMGFNNDPRTSFADIQTLLGLLEVRIAKRLRWTTVR